MGHALHVDGRTDLVPLEERDAPELYAEIARNRAHLARWLPWAAAATEESVRTFLRACAEQFARGDSVTLGVVHEGRLAGSVATHLIDHDAAATSLGYWLSADLQGRGLATACVRRLVDHCVDDLALHRLELRAAVENARSRAVAERLGFRLEGILREALLVDGARQDAALYAVLAPEWRHPARRANVAR